MTRTLFLKDDSVAAFVRAEMPVRELTRRGHNVAAFEYKELPIPDMIRFPRVIFQRPIGDMRQVFRMLHQAGAEIVVDFDDDFMSIPPDHPGFKIIGRGNPQAMENMYWSIQHADLLTVSTPELYSRLSPLNGNTCIIPNYWEDTNPVWSITPRLKAIQPDRINIGWAGSMTHAADLAPVLPQLVRLMKEYPEARIIIGGDYAAYGKLDKVPENQKHFIPGLPYLEYPWIIKHFDILLAPILDTPLNRAKSDLKLIEAGAAGIPYVASKVGPYIDSINPGGLLAAQPADFIQLIGHLLNHSTARAVYGEMGQKAVDLRRITKMTAWETIVTAESVTKLPFRDLPKEETYVAAD